MFEIIVCVHCNITFMWNNVNALSWVAGIKSQQWPELGLLEQRIKWMNSSVSHCIVSWIVRGWVTKLSINWPQLCWMNVKLYSIYITHTILHSAYGVSSRMGGVSSRRAVTRTTTTVLSLFAPCSHGYLPWTLVEIRGCRQTSQSVVLTLLYPLCYPSLQPEDCNRYSVFSTQSVT